MAISLALAVIGGIIIFATHGVHFTAFPWLNVYAMGWVLLIVGGIAFALSAAAARGTGRWFGRWFGGRE